ncbi:unnamed protein product [Toxocara canis]|uniref:Uncharacterized protein n=1 Tax=Toxocara canis TaxID=6265 RepID=A0A183U915_TOXCA|nr:unnamed protein product [Toxocara canis]
MAVAELSDREYMEWEPDYYRASIALDGREKLIQEQAEKIERVRFFSRETATEFPFFFRKRPFRYFFSGISGVSGISRFGTDT